MADLGHKDWPRQYPEAARAIAQADIVLHAAAAMVFFPDEQDPARSAAHMRAVNVNGTGGVAQHLHSHATLIYISSTEAMGPCSHCSEAAPLHPTFQYGASKRDAENAVRKAPGSHVILRLTGLMGPGDDFSLFQLMLAVNLGLLPFTVTESTPNKGAGSAKGDALIMYTHVHDAVQAVRLAMLHAAQHAGCSVSDQMQLRSPPGRARGFEKQSIISLAIPSSSAHPRSALNHTFIVAPRDALSVSGWITAIASELHHTRPAPFFSLPLGVAEVLQAPR